MSDLHLEKWGADWRKVVGIIPEAKADVLVLAGDIVSLNYYSEDEVEKMFRALAEKARRTVFVPGNHEYFGVPTPTGLRGKVPRRVDEWLRTRLPEWGIDVLSPETGIPTIGGRRFVGATMWYPDGPMNVMHEKYMADFSEISEYKPWVYERHELMKLHLQTEVGPGDVVVTHHLPSRRSVHPRFERSKIGAFFTTEMDSLIHDEKPALWVHGHTHHGFDYVLGETRVVANPLGYPSELAKGWSQYKEGFVVELPEVVA